MKNNPMNTLLSKNYITLDCTVEYLQPLNWTNRDSFNSACLAADGLWADYLACSSVGAVITFQCDRARLSSHDRHLSSRTQASR